jgi:hypothetical protein
MMRRKKIQLPALIACLLVWAAQAYSQHTETLYLSGKGKDDGVNWQFYCTAGRQSGKWTTIPVPSNWELQGFGTYNYGLDKDSLRGKEKGLYKYAFTVPASWKNKTVEIVFEGSMTDTEVKINGRPAGPVHQGAFYRFRYNISSLLHAGKQNLLEVTVAKHSANASVNAAERKGDFWIFGGIYRPVYLEALPAQHIQHAAIDAKADGRFQAKLALANIQQEGVLAAQLYTAAGQKVGDVFRVPVKKGDTLVQVQTVLNRPACWTPETPHLYKVVFTLLQEGQEIHTFSRSFGFRTVELREHDGIYVNGVKIKFRGVNRHSFWPSSGRTTSKALSIADAVLMKEMNMNAVRMSHYPPDEHFLDACDSLGLFVLDELTGWHHAYDTLTGTRLVREMVERDVNHPCIVLWDNGNEGGHNFALDAIFGLYDIQHRPVIHPWQIFGGTDTQHYINFGYGNGTHLNGHNIVFPTEFLHGLYDGGHGAGLEDYWEQMWQYPLSAGGFLWVFSDEAVLRTDRNGTLDADGDHGPDGILGPYREKEGSYYTIKAVWSPVFIRHGEITPSFDGRLNIENRFFYTNINRCSFTWKLVKSEDPYGNIQRDSVTGTVPAPDIQPGQNGWLQLSLPQQWQQYTVLYVTAYDAAHRTINTWSWPIASPAKLAAQLVDTSGSTAPVIKEDAAQYQVQANGIQLVFDKHNGLLQQVKNSSGIIPLNNGPLLCDSGAGTPAISYRYEAKKLVIEGRFEKSSLLHTLRWTVYPSGWLKLDAGYFPKEYESKLLGISFSFPESDVKSVDWLGDGPYRVWKNRLKGPLLDVWKKAYNNTITGVGEVVYPEFKGYYSRFYWMKLHTAAQPFTVVCGSDDIFLRLFTPAQPAKPYNTAPPFPGGNISFMHGIPAIGTKTQKPEKTGPMGQDNMYYDYGKDPSYAKTISLFFDFSGK